MGILELPLELFQQIIEEAIVLRDGGVPECCMGLAFLTGRPDYPQRNCPRWQHHGRWDNRDIVSLALVNTAFEAEVFKVLRSRQFLAPDVGELSAHFLGHPNVATFLARFALTRPYQPYDDSVVHFPGVINNIVEKIIKLESFTRNIDQIRSRFTTKLCYFAAAQGFTKLYITPTRNGSIDDHLLVAAIYLNRTALVDSLLAPRRDLLKAWSNFWGFALIAATSIEDVDLLRQLMQYGAKWAYCKRCLAGRSPMTQVVRTSKALEIVTVLLERETRFSIWDEYGEALCLAIELDKSDVAITILEAHRSRHADHGLHQKTIYKTLFLASEKKQRNTVRKILEVERYFNTTQWSGFKRTELSRKTCEEGQEMVLEVLLERSLELDMQQPWLDYTLKATVAGHVGIVRILIHTGVIPGTYPLRNAEALKILGEAAPRQNSTDVIRLLLHHGVIDLAQLQGSQTDVDFELVHCIIVAAQRGNIGFLETVAREGIPLEDEVCYSRADCPLPIIAAKEFHQMGTVQALLKLGVADADPMQSVLARQSENGTSPRDPTPFKSVIPAEDVGREGMVTLPVYVNRLRPLPSPPSDSEDDW